MTVVGINVMLEVFTAKKVIMERLASDLLPFSFFICSIALMPRVSQHFPTRKNSP